ncbi:YihY/virulence factor BrkB family protein [Paraburkholderia hospita]|jgi:membrane protein|uniref:YihY/virulence factor BrkB family protein n=1 Tax=Paraburkholderia hospita TaxID=169430 RepID=UPI000271ADCF|nr:YihY/virulence factor BrkB family protein [Paraburkholderia hospita]EUC15991.1 ribonuclease BN [Burkholderia sp. BT03]SKC80818.1 membrane protein [Paraburkholderia hospita]
MELDSLSADKLQTVAKKQASWAAGALRQFSENRCAAMAASIAFYAAFSLAPTLVMVIAISGWFFGAEAARGELFRQVHSVLGNDAAAAVTTIVQNAHRSGGAGGIAAIISFVLLAVGASATFSSLNSALNIVWPSVAPRASSVFALVRVRLISFGLVLGVAFLLIVSLVLDTAITFVGNWIWGDSPYVVIGNLLQLAVGWMVLAFAFAALLKFLPDAPVRWRDALVGGTVAAALFSAGKKLFALYLAHAGMANSFGAAGSLAVLLMWLYFSAVVLLLGAEFAAARGRMHDPRGAWGLAPATPPGSRAMLASVLAASTVATDARRRPVSDPQPSSAVTPPTPRPSIATRLLAKHDAGIGKAVSIGKTVIKAETQATRAAAVTIVEAGRRAVAADRYVRRHPWESMLIAASTAMAVAAFARRCNASNDAETPPSDNASR